MKQDRRGSWYLLTGIVLGIAIGLLYSWVISPVKYVDAPPYALRADYKDEYRAMVAAAYLYSGDILRAKDRLAQLKDDDIAQAVAIQVQRALAEGHGEAEVKALGLLAVALNERAFPQRVLTQTNPNNTSEVTQSVHPTSISTLSPILGQPFVLQETKLVCNPDQPLPMIQVNILDATGQPIPSVKLIVSWDGGEDSFFTGLQPELGMGYADFVMTPQVVYKLRVTEDGQSVNDITTAECLSDDGSQYWGSWLLTFIQP